MALIGLGCSASFGPLMADISHWFVRRRGIAVAIAASGNYLAGTIWPPVVQHFIATDGWRATHIGIGLFCFVAMLPLVLLLRRRIEDHHSDAAGAAAARRQAEAPFSPMTLQVLLCIAGVACCVAMSMPQVHIVAYCGDLGYGVARGAEMLSLMLGFGIISRVASGFIADRIGGVRTLLLGSVLQGVALFLYLWFDGLVSLYVISALFGLFQGGIVPSYAIIVREYFSPREAGTRLGLVLMATLLGMALGGWMSGVIFDLTGSYRAAFLNGLGLESGERVDHGLAAAAIAQQREAGGGLKCVRALQYPLIPAKAGTVTECWMSKWTRTRRPAIPSWRPRPPGCGQAASPSPAACAP